MSTELDTLMNQMLDGLLSQEDEQAFKKELLFSEPASDRWQSMQFIDATLRQAPEFSPSLDFAENVMGQVDRYEQQQAWRPWILALLAFASSVSVLSITAPLLFFVFGLHSFLLKLPIIGSILLVITTIVQFLFEALLAWITFVTTDPIALSVVIAALVVASTYVGLRESQRMTTARSQTRYK